MERQLRRALTRLVESGSFSQRNFWIGRVAELEGQLAKQR